ncbi:MAG: restriction endonuclease subunit S [Ignavibacteriaceae bacterium]|nr:restriction endonuclease subunit S [Ignavibacteriaceae bacterium]
MVAQIIYKEMSIWNKLTVGEIADLNIKSIDKNFLFNTIEYLDTGSITNGKIDSFQILPIEKAPSRAKRLVKANDIIYSTVRPIQKHFGFIKNCNPNMVVSTGFAVISPNNKFVSSKFLYYYLTTEEVVSYLDVIAEASTSAYPSLRPEDISSLEIELPPIDDQIQIADILSSLDDKIDLLNRQNKTLEALAETLFRQWFIEEVDESWEDLSLDQIADFLNGLACQKYPPLNDIEKLPVIKIKEMNSGYSDKSDYVTSQIESKYLVEPGDILFSWSGSLDLCIWPYEKGVLNQHLFKVTSLNYPKWFYFFVIKYHLPEFRVIAESKSTTMGHIQRHHLTDARFKKPSKDLLIEKNEIIEPLFSKIILNHSQIRTLTQLRDTLLPKLMSGEVRVE